MSPALRTMLDDAADDRGRPLAVDLARVRSNGRRAIWRRRAVAGASAVGVTAAIAGGTVILAPSGGTRGDPAGSGRLGEQVAVDASEAEKLAPLFDALAARGYDLDQAASGGGSAVGGETEDGTEFSSMTASIYAITRDGDIGTVAVAEFTDLTTLGGGAAPQLSPPPGPPPDPEESPAADAASDLEESRVRGCAIDPTLGDPDFAWTSCDSHVDATAEGADHWFAATADGEALGVTLVRSDASGISVSLSTKAYAGPQVDGLDTLPLTHLELVEVLAALDRNAPLFEGDTYEVIPPPVQVECPPPFNHDEGFSSSCDDVSVSDGIVDGTPLIGLLSQLGIAAEEVGGTGSGQYPEVAHSTLFRLTDRSGHGGMAAIGLASTLDVAHLMGDREPWCAVEPTYDSGPGWQLASDPNVRCQGVPTGEPQVVVRQFPGADAIGATLVRPDGSVISVSISVQPYSSPMEAPRSPLEELPIDSVSLLDLLALLDAANPAV